MNWYIGQGIVCVKTHPDKSVIRGKTYKIKSLRSSFCSCNHILIDVGIPLNNNESGNICGSCGCTNDSLHSWFHESRFAPLDQDITEIAEILEQPIKQVVKL